MSKLTIAQCSEKMARLEPCESSTGNFSGETYASSFGYMPKWAQDAYCKDRDSIGIDYVIFSYWTPIAWHRKDGAWIMPDTKYSITTSAKHWPAAHKAARYQARVISNPDAPVKTRKTRKAA